MESTPSGPTNVVHCSVDHGLHLEREKVRALLDADEFFWLDIHDPKSDDLEILREEFGFHPLSLEDSWQFNQRPKIDDRIDVLEDRIFREADDAQLQEIFSMKRALVSMRKVISPQRDLFSSIVTGVETFPGMTDDDQRYFRDVYDHLIRIGDMVDTYRDLLTGAMDVYLSTVSNRLNAVMKQLAIIATVFMPLTFLTGFFGQNLGWMVAHAGGLGHFLVFGIGLELMTLAIVLTYFRRRGWLSR